MPSNKQIPDYCRQVAEQIRWKRACPAVVQELEQHLLDQQEAYLDQGYGEEEAARMAVEQMGDARQVGQALNRAHRPQTPWFPLVATVGLLLMGALLQTTLAQQPMPLISYAVAAVLFAIGYFCNISWLGKHAMEIYLGVLAFSTVMLIGSEPVDGAAVFQISPMQLQLCYLALVFPVVYGLFPYGMKGLGTRGVVYGALAYFPFALILLAVPTMSGLLIYTFAAWAMLAVTIRKNWFSVPGRNRIRNIFVPVIFPAFALTGAFLSVKGTRLQVFLSPWQDSVDTGRVYCLLRDAVAQAALWGEGRADLSVIPTLSENYVLLYGIQRFGLGAFAVLMLLILGIGMFCIVRGMQQRTMLGTLLVLAVALTFVLQAFAYAYANLGYGLWDTLSFPFLSRGNTALLLDSLLLGCMLSVLRTGVWLLDTEPQKYGIKLLGIEKR